jgi:nucleotide-binding universal stress UspA family protein
MKILLPYDGSEASEKAVKQALSLAENSKSSTELVLLNVIEEIVLPTTIFERPRFRSRISGEEISSDALGKELTQDMMEKMAASLERKKIEILKKYPKLDAQITTKTVMGYPTDAIIGFAEEEKVDIIVIGSVGLSGVKRLKALGSVSRAVTEKATCPVLIVH